MSSTQKESPSDFSNHKLRRFISPALGLVFNAPVHWQEDADSQYFSVGDPQTGAHLTASGYENPGMTLAQWAQARLGTITQAMPFLRVIEPPREMQGAAWTGIIAEYQGVFPEHDEESRYVVLCLRTDASLFSVTFSASGEDFERNAALYRWLLQTQLELYSVVKVQEDEAGAAVLLRLAEEGNPNAQFRLAKLYEEGVGVAQDYRLATGWYRKAAGQWQAQLRQAGFDTGAS